jgi:hypothetical protein
VPRVRNVVAILAVVCWVVILSSETVGERPLVGAGLLIAAYVLSCAGLVVVVRAQAELHLFVKVLCVLAAAPIAFVMWARVLVYLPIGLVEKSAPHWLKFIGVLIPSAIAAMVIGALLLVPAALLLRRYHWTIPVLGSAVGFVLTGAWPDSKMTLGQNLHLLALAEFATLPAIGLYLMAPKIRRVVGAG